LTRIAACLQRVALAALFLSLAAFSTASAEPWSAPTKVYLDDAGHTLDGLFLDEWRTNKAVLGDPISEEIETDVPVDALQGLPDDPDRPAKLKLIVQYFEHAAIVYVPDAADSALRVQTLPLGEETLDLDLEKNDKLTLPNKADCKGLDDQCAVSEESGYSIRYGFKDFWENNDGARLLGQPLSEEFKNDKKESVQYFEKAVLIWTEKDGVEPREIGKETAKRLKIPTAPIQQPVDVPVYDEELFVAPAGTDGIGYDLGEGPGPVQGGYKEIVISVGAQTMWAYESGDLIVSTLVSTGTGEVPETVTPIGYYSIWVKYLSQTMEGTISNEYYRVEDVPWVMYFDYAGNAIHGAYWHNNFGAPMSHGCVNLPLDVAEFLYGWAPEGTLVTVIA
jgi:hypothetical protein